MQWSRNSRFDDSDESEEEKFMRDTAEDLPIVNGDGSVSWQRSDPFPFSLSSSSPAYKRKRVLSVDSSSDSSPPELVPVDEGDEDFDFSPEDFDFSPEDSDSFAPRECEEPIPVSLYRIKGTVLAPVRDKLREGGLEKFLATPLGGAKDSKTCKALELHMADFLCFSYFELFDEDIGPEGVSSLFTFMERVIRREYTTLLSRYMVYLDRVLNRDPATIR